MRKIDLDSSLVVKLDEIVLKPKKNIPKKIRFFRILSIFMFLVCALVIVTEGTVIFNYKYTLLDIVMNHFLTLFR